MMVLMTRVETTIIIRMAINITTENFCMIMMMMRRMMMTTMMVMTMTTSDNHAGKQRMATTAKAYHTDNQSTTNHHHDDDDDYVDGDENNSGGGAGAMNISCARALHPPLPQPQGFAVASGGSPNCRTKSPYLKLTDDERAQLLLG